MSAPSDVQAAAIESPWFGRTIAGVRVVFGLVFLSNGLAKFAPAGGSGSPLGFLIDAQGARSILEFEVLPGGAREMGHPVAPYRVLVEQVILPNFDLFGPLIGMAEAGAGLLLVLGLLTPIGALGAAGLQLHLHFMTLFNNKFLWEYPVYWVPLLGLAILRAGRWYGIDAGLARRRPRAWWW
jgi:uncharacterized membrane protein YphA (DoxX/SURF4 family)